MSIRKALPAPPIVEQDPARCWEAAYDSWNRANHDAFDYPLGPSADTLVRAMRRGRGLILPNGHATVAGMEVTGAVGLMRLLAWRGPAVTHDLVAALLHDGYVYCAYYRARRGRPMIGHAGVLYAAGPEGFLFMDPAPGRGLVQLPPAFFEPRAAVALGVTIFANMRRQLSAALAPVTR